MNDNQTFLAKIVGITKAVGIILAIFLVFLTISEIKGLSTLGKSPSYPSNITVKGKAEVLAKPDIANFSFTVLENGKTLAEAQDQVTKKIDLALEMIKKGGVEEKDIDTSSYNINPRYEYIPSTCDKLICVPSRQNIIGYEVSHTISVKVRNIKEVGNIFESVAKTGVNSLNQVNFTIDDTDTIMDQARVEALADSRARAEIIAKSLGVKIVKITGYYQNDNSLPYMNDMMVKSSSLGVSAEMARAPQIPVGEQKMTSEVYVTYEIR